MIVPLIIILLDITVRNAHLKCENIQKQVSEGNSEWDRYHDVIFQFWALYPTSSTTHEIWVD